MNNFEFKIFGAPHTFDLYKGSEGEIGYFQNFDNGGKENVKFTIHRMVSGKVSYSYLRYNFISSSGRPNSFFGMSVVFDNYYCKDIDGLFRLFDAVYEDIILENKILLTELNNNASAQAKYLIQTFAEKAGEVTNIEDNIVKNVKTYFADNIVPLDGSFSESSSMVRLNDQMSNDRFVKALQKYSWVHISPQYSKTETPVPNHEFLDSLDDVIGTVKKQIPSISINALKGRDIEQEARNYSQQAENALEMITSWLNKNYKQKKKAHKDYWQKQPELKERRDELLEIQETLGELIAAIDTTSKEPEAVLPDTEKEKGQWFAPVAALWQENKFGIIAGTLVGIAALVGFIFLAQPSTQETSDNTPVGENIQADSFQQLVDSGYRALENGNFNEAIRIFEGIDSTDLADHARREAIQYWSNKAINAETYEAAIEHLKQTRTYGHNPESAIAEYRGKIAARNAANGEPERTATNTSSSEEQDESQQEETIDCSDARIHITKNKRPSYSKDDKFTVVAKVGSTVCQGGEWRFEPGLFIDKSKNPTEVQIMNVPDDGHAKLTYWIDDKAIESITVKIVH